MFRIGEFSKMTKTTIKTLRYYDEVGLLKPAQVDVDSKYRFYTTDQLIQLHKIVALRQAGLSIEEVLSIMAGADKKKILHLRRAEIKSQLEEAKKQLSFIDFILSEKEEDFFMDYQAIIKELPKCIVYSKKLTVPNYDAYFQVIPAIGEEVKKLNPTLKCAVPEYCFIAYLDGEYKDRDINIEFCEAVESFGVESEDIKFKEIDSVTAVSVMHKGAYKDLAKAYAFAFKWVEDNNYIILDNPRENYIDGIWNKEKEEDWLTELQIPIVKK